MDRIMDDQTYTLGKFIYMYIGLNRGKNCGRQGKDNNVFQTEDAFKAFVKQYGNFFNLHVDNTINDNVVIYVRFMLKNLVTNYVDL